MYFDITFSELMSHLGYEKYPEHWKEIYPLALSDLEKGKYLVFSPDYFDELYEKYGTPNNFRDSFKECAKRVSNDKYLTAFLALLCKTLENRESAPNDVKGLQMPKDPSGRPNVAYDLIGALAAISMLPYAYENMKKRNLPEEVIRNTLARIEYGVSMYTERHDGNVGYSSIEWNQRAIDGKIFRVGRLEYDVLFPLASKVCVFENSLGKQIPIASGITLHKSGFALGAKHFEDTEGAWTADITEDSDAWYGYPYNDRGYVEKEQISLPKNEWKKVLCEGDPVIGVHIPAERNLRPEEVDVSLDMAEEFFSMYFPEWKYKAFYCSSWMMDPQLIDMLGEDSNIAKFKMRFQALTCKSQGNAVFNFIFKKPDTNFSISELPENTRFERALKEHYLSGKAIYEMQGYFFHNKKNG